MFCLLFMMIDFAHIASKVNLNVDIRLDGAVVYRPYISTISSVLLLTANFILRCGNRNTELLRNCVLQWVWAVNLDMCSVRWRLATDYYFLFIVLRPHASAINTSSSVYSPFFVGVMQKTHTRIVIGRKNSECVTEAKKKKNISNYNNRSTSQ